MNSQSVETFNIEWNENFDGFNAIAAFDLKPGDIVIHE